ncbi:putative MFS maltose permease [Aspergillus affinis]|uniref:putative MFS maltose permease n=1 Tax=Aspergillus affinis TaxID=1070780 RepID=UPI0022FE6512|nr:putative transporter [Aspergillus affinis]KAI9041102.1 putative transporter [Aspergillus affinis]
MKNVRHTPSTLLPPFAMTSETAHDGAHKSSLVHGKQAARQEQSMTLWQAIRLYPKAVGWSVLLSTTLIMEGYDLALLGSMYASPAFNQKFGYLAPDGSWTVPASWQSALSNGARVGEVIGLLINGLISERLGYRWTMVCALMAINGVIFIFFFAVNVKMLLAAEILAGIPWGIFQTLPAAYASEVCPVVLRPYLTTFINMCWVIGQFVAVGVNRGSIQREDQWSYRIPFAVQWAWPLPILIGCLFAPESPWWHVRRGQIDGAKKALRRLTSSKDPSFDVDATIAMIQHTNELEKSLTEGTRYTDCFRGVNLRRTEVVCGVWLVQTLCGQNLMGYFAYFCVQAGLPPVQSFNLSLAQYGLGVLGTIGSWFLMSVAGRRTLHLAGLATLVVLLLITGSLSFAPEANSAAKWAIGAMLIVFTVCYDLTIGPVTYSLVSELSSTRLKAKTIVLARVVYNVSNIVVNVLTNYQLNQTAWDWGARCAYFWAGTCLVCLCWSFFRVPEPKGRTYEEMDVLFTQGVSARKFSQTAVDPYEGMEVEVREDHGKDRAE